MSPVVDSNSAFSCTTIRYLVDAKRDVSLPVSVILWSREQNRLWFRLPKEHERIEGVSVVAAMPYLEMAQAQIEGWFRRGQLPYASEPLTPLSEPWWDRVRQLMQWSVRLGPVQPIDCQQPDEEIETLYEALVQPQTQAGERRQRIDGAITRALGTALSARFSTRAKAPGFRNRPVPVLRLAEDERHAVVVEAVNLASATAELDADAMASRLRRIRENEEHREIRFLLGYVASAGGLNGEHVLKEWIEREVGERMYDLAREKSTFREAVSRAIADLNDSLGLYESDERHERPSGTLAAG